MIHFLIRNTTYFFGVYWTEIREYFIMSQHRGCKSEKRHSMVIEVMRLTII